MKRASINMMGKNYTIEQMLEESGVYVGTTKGVSMEPLLHSQRDVVVIRKASGRLKENDVPLYRRGENYVLHRIIKVQPDSYVILGDNCINKEYGITDDQIVGVLTEFYRKEKHYTVDDLRYRIYVKCVRILFPFRIVYQSLRGCAAGIYRRYIKK